MRLMDSNHEKHGKLLNKKQHRIIKAINVSKLFEGSEIVKKKNILDVNAAYDFYDINSDDELKY